MTTETELKLHGGRLVARRLKAHGVTKLFTLSGGHLFSIYDGCREEGIDIVDTRHEQASAFAAAGNWRLSLLNTYLQANSIRDDRL